MGIQPGVRSQDRLPFPAEFEGPVGGGQDPRPDWRLEIDQPENLLEPPDHGANSEQSPSLIECGDDGPRRQMIASEVTSADCRPNEAVAGVVAPTCIELRHPVLDGADIIAYLGCLGSAKRHFDDWKGFASDVRLKQRPVGPAALDLGNDGIETCPGHPEALSRRSRYSSIVMVVGASRCRSGCRSNRSPSRRAR